jgi:hypothetical protein
VEDPHLISVDELRLAGALDVPPAWRKSLGEERRYSLPGFDDDDAELETVTQTDTDESEDELL